MFGIDVQTCADYGDTMHINARIQDPVVIKVVLAYRADNARAVSARVARPGE